MTGEKPFAEPSAHAGQETLSGYDEWRPETRGKSPYYIHPKGNRFIAYAGLYDVWTKPDDDELHTFTIITKDSDGFVAQLHNRMPVILDRDLEDAWLDTEITNARDVLDILERSSSVTLDAYPASLLVNKPSGDSKVLIQPLG
jgi:putative SOS response-associated peptidase YedK